MTELNSAKEAGEETSRLDSLANALIRVSEIRPFHYTVSYPHSSTLETRELELIRIGWNDSIKVL
jgi:hypothetical protein